MTRKSYFALWGGLFLLCAGLGFITEPEGGLKWLLVGLSVVFFLPPMILLRAAKQKKDWTTVRLIRNLSILSLAATVVVLILNFMSIAWSEAAGNALHSLLVVISAPMFCGQYWLLSLFLWACVLMVSVQHLKNEK